MTAKISSRPYSDIAAETSAACAWLAKLGFDYQCTRFGYYERYLSQLASLTTQPDTPVNWSPDQYLEFFEVAVDADEVCRIYRGLSNQSGEDLKKRVKLAIKGRHRLTMEGAGGTGRDFSFELATAAQFALCGLNVDFGTDADVRLRLADCEVFVECKRPGSSKGVEEAVKTGLRQLGKRFENDARGRECRGVLAISIAKTVNPNFWHLTASTPNQLSDLAAAEVANFVGRYRTYWATKWDSRVMAVVAVLDAPAYIGQLRQEFVAHETGLDLNPTAESSVRNLWYLHNMGWGYRPRR